MQSVGILEGPTELKKRQRFMLKQSTNLQIKRESKRMKISQNQYLTNSIVEFLRAYRDQNIFFYAMEPK